MIIDTKTYWESANRFNTMLDVGCNTGKFVKTFSGSKAVGIDMCDDALAVAQQMDNPLLKEKCSFQKLDAMKILDEFGENSFECVSGCDIVEHLEKDEGVKFIGLCESVASKCVQFFIPVGHHPQNKAYQGFDNKRWQTHRASWYPQYMVSLGYSVIYFPDWHNCRYKDPDAMWCWKEFDDSWLPIFEERRKRAPEWLAEKRTQKYNRIMDELEQGLDIK